MVKKLDEMSLRIIQGSCEVLKVRDAMDKTEDKKKTGKFTALEAKKLCQIFKAKFDYLFQTEE